VGKRKDPIVRIICFLFTLSLTWSASGCHLGYILHAARGQFQLVHESVPVEDALKADSLDLRQKDRLRLVAKIKAFGETQLGLKKTQNYQTVYLKSRLNPIYTVSASPKDRLTRITWWFPVVGNVPYLAFFELERAREEREKLAKKDLDVIVSAAAAYSTLGWFNDPVTLNLLEGSTVDLVDTILHEMTHTTLYVKGQGAFNEGLAVLVGRYGSIQFFEKYYGPSHPFTMEAGQILEDERVFSSFLASLFEELERLYNSPLSYQEKLQKREKIFSTALEEFKNIEDRLKTDRFTHFGNTKLNNAYLMSIGLYHRNFHLFEAVLKKKDGSIRDTLSFFEEMAGEGGDLLEKTMTWCENKGP
jgi:predicted aminopeptidase